MQGLVMNVLEHVKTRQATPGSFADLLRQVKDPKTGAPLTAQQMLPEVAALFFAGIDTTGHTGAWCLCASDPSLFKTQICCLLHKFLTSARNPS